MKIVTGCFVVFLLVAQAFATEPAHDGIRLMLQDSCLPCHDQFTRSSGFSVHDVESIRAGGARYGRAVTPGRPAESPLIKMLRGEIKPQMPLGKPALPEADIATIERWIEELEPNHSGAAQAEEAPHWAFVKPQTHPFPAVRDKQWVRNGIDHFVLSKLEEKSLAPAGEADRRVLARRAYFDLLGLPPAPEEVTAFVESRSPRAYEELIDRLLADPRYGERWGRHWLDLARYADSNGYEGDPEYFHTWRYRDYVIDAFNHDKPYDLFIKEQLAGDEFAKVMSARPLPAPEPERVVAMTFLRLAPFTEPRGERSRDELLSEMVSTAGSVFLGLTVGCAKCHDHKYDPIPTRDFYRMKAFFATVQVDPARPGDVQQIGGPQPAEFYRPGEKQWADEARARYKQELEATAAEFAAFKEPLLEKLVAARKSEQAAHTKAEETEEVTLQDLEKAIVSQEDTATNGKLFSLDETEKYRQFSKHILRLENLILRVEPSAFSVRTADGPPYGPSVPATYVLTRGQWDQPGDPVKPGFPSAITGDSEPAKLVEVDRYQRHPAHGRRMTLANWIASPENPLTARVMVNRIWQHHFGRGIVETSSDFGKNGMAPTHPELLDWLALRLVEEEWSIKAIHRLILTSSTYRQSSQVSDPKAEQVDMDNHLLWRSPRRRLEGEAIRDSVLAVSGRLNPNGGGLPVFPPLPSGLDKELLGFENMNIWEASEGPDSRERSIYVFQRRSLSLPLLQTFDAQVLTDSCDRRRTSTTPLQALSLYDGDLVNTEARYFAQRVREESGPDTAAQIRRAFQLTLSRLPTASELARTQGFFESVESPRDPLVGLGRVLLNSNEFLYVD